MSASGWRVVSVGVLLACTGCAPPPAEWDYGATASLFIDSSSRAVACMNRAEDRASRPACMQVVAGVLSEATEFQVKGTRTPRLGYRGDEFLALDGSTLKRVPLDASDTLTLFDGATTFLSASGIANGEWIAAGLKVAPNGTVEVHVGAPSRGLHRVDESCLGGDRWNPALLSRDDGMRLVNASSQGLGGTICSLGTGSAGWVALPFEGAFENPSTHVGRSQAGEPVVVTRGPDQLRTVAVGFRELTELGALAVTELHEFVAAAAPGGAWAAYSRGAQRALAVTRVEAELTTFSSETVMDEGPLVPTTMVTGSDGATWLLAVDPEQLTADEPPMVLFRFNGRQWERFSAPMP